MTRTLWPPGDDEGRSSPRPATAFNTDAASRQEDSPASHSSGQVVSWRHVHDFVAPFLADVDSWPMVGSGAWCSSSPTTCGSGRPCLTRRSIGHSASRATNRHTPMPPRRFPPPPTGGPPAPRCTDATPAPASHGGRPMTTYHLSEPPDDQLEEHAVGEWGGTPPPWQLNGQTTPSATATWAPNTAPATAASPGADATPTAANSAPHHPHPPPPSPPSSAPTPNHAGHPPFFWRAPSGLLSGF